MLRNALLQPVEITNSNKTFNISSSNYVIATGVYANVFEVARAIDYAMGGAGTTYAYFTDDFKHVVDGGTAPSVSTPLSRLMGWTGSESASGGVITASYRPQRCFVPTYYSSDTRRWHELSDDLFSGSVGSDGNLSGITLSAQEERSIDWPWESAPNTYEEAASLSVSISGTVYYPEAERCFWTVANSARTSHLTASTSGNVSSKGVYFLDQLHRLLGASPATAWPTSWDSGSTKFDLTNTAHRSLYCFCSVPTAPQTPGASKSDLAAYYDLAITLRTASAPTWADPSLSGGA